MDIAAILSVANGEWRIANRGIPFPLLPIRLAPCSLLFLYLLPAIRFSLSFFSIRYSLFATRCLQFFAAPMRGVRSAVGAWMPAKAPLIARHDRRADAPSNDRPEQMPALRSLRTTGSPWPRSICAIRASQPALRRGVLRFQRLETLAFTALHVGFLARARARRSPIVRLRQRLRRTGSRPSETSFEGLSGQPRQSLRDRAPFLRTGHRYPKEQVSRTSPARSLAASGDATVSLRLARTPLEDAPQDRDWCNT
jgi:hypothetical protein